MDKIITHKDDAAATDSEAIPILCGTSALAMIRRSPILNTSSPASDFGGSFAGVGSGSGGTISTDGNVTRCFGSGVGLGIRLGGMNTGALILAGCTAFGVDSSPTFVSVLFSKAFFDQSNSGLS